MSDNFSVSSSTSFGPPSSISDKSNQPDISREHDSPLSEQVQKTENVILTKNVFASLKESYNSSSAELESPQLQLTAKDISDLASLSQQNRNSDSTLAVNSSAASEVLAIYEAYLQNQKEISKYYYNPGALHAAVTPVYQQEVEVAASGVSEVLPFVAATALSIQQNTATNSSGLTSDQKGPDIAEQIFRSGQGEKTKIDKTKSKAQKTGLLLNQIFIGFNRGINERHTDFSNNSIARPKGNFGPGSRIKSDLKNHSIMAIIEKEDTQLRKDETNNELLSTATYSDAYLLNLMEESLSGIERANNSTAIEQIKVRLKEQNKDQTKALFYGESSHHDKHSKHGEQKHISTGMSVPKTSFVSDQPFVDGPISGLAAGAININSAIAIDFGEGLLAASLNQINFITALQKGIATLSQVTSPLRSQPIKAG